MSTVKKIAKENKKAIDTRFSELFKELQKEKKVNSVVEFANELAVTHPNNIHSIFRSAEGETTSVRHVNEELILAMNKVYGVNEMYLRYGILPKFLPNIQKNDKVSKKYKTNIAAIIDVFNLTDTDLSKLLNTSISRIVQLKEGKKDGRELTINEMRILRAELNIPYEFLIEFNGTADELKKLIAEQFGSFADLRSRLQGRGKTYKYPYHREKKSK
jgi:hypothetical protein